MADYNLYFSQEAKDSFEALLEQVKKRWGVKTAKQFQKDTRRVLGVVAKYPFAFQTIQEDMHVRRAIVHRNISFLYCVVGDEVQIIVFFDNRQEPIL
ncbi:Plasmid stabilization system protein ParE [Parapedobacter luteus]|uniref:Plasmid stabilization system protein ParE n=1 Tax=Parapedobacter luteus TaxID=623280 RepID=A0A1T4ZX06_9SPHI|nr:type II toxin-antitoxin system RelE/ParE family toxin [Parapedobacter luteus]SKB26893.1 Plasmid stabilization system protein ParE [Parapedobacter luteus]